MSARDEADSERERSEMDRVEDRIAAREQAIGNAYQEANGMRRYHEDQGEESIRRAAQADVDNSTATFGTLAVAHFAAASYYSARMTHLRGAQ